MADTELILTFWRFGSLQAERLAASVLALIGYDEIDPQAPLGGPDDTKDILCLKGGRKWVGAVYFPVGPVRFASVKKKFSHDLLGSKPYDGMAFVTNQQLTLGQRKVLTDLAQAAEKDVDIVHLERLRALMDMADGYGTRLQFLRIPMTIDEQLSWFTASGTRLEAALGANTRELMVIKAMLQRVSAGQTEIIRTLDPARPLPFVTPDLVSATAFTRADDYPALMSTLAEPHLLAFHRLLCLDFPERVVGRFRNSDVRLGKPDGTPADHIQPPAAKEVPVRLASLLQEWRDGYARLVGATTSAKLTALASFHSELLVIHPFFDGNGRVARAILMQQCLDLFGRADMSVMDKGARYYAGLTEADRGNPAPLAAVIAAAVEGAM